MFGVVFSEKVINTMAHLYMIFSGGKSRKKFRSCAKNEKKPGAGHSPSLCTGGAA